MTNGKTPDWLEELLDAEIDKEKDRLIEMSKIKADHALAAIAVLEGKINEVNDIAQKEIDIIQNWNMAEVGKLQKKIDWLVFNLENFMKTTGEKTISLPHGKISFRMGRDKVEVIDLQKFLPTGQRLGLVRITPAKTEPDLLAIAAYVKLNGRPPAGVMLTPGQQKFYYKTKGTSDVDNQWNNGQQTETRTDSGQAGQAHAA